MIIKNLLDNFGNFYLTTKNNFRSFYQKSNLYDKKISRISDKNLQYKPSPHLLSSIVKYQSKKYKIDDFATESIWQNNINAEEYRKLHNFFWFFSLDLKSSKEKTQEIITILLTFIKHMYVAHMNNIKISSNHPYFHN